MNLSPDELSEKQANVIIPHDEYMQATRRRDHHAGSTATKLQVCLFGSLAVGQPGWGIPKAKKYRIRR